MPTIRRGFGFLSGFSSVEGKGSVGCKSEGRSSDLSMLGLISSLAFSISALMEAIDKGVGSREDNLI